MAKVFLGGTCGDTNWRERLIEMLSIDYFNPVVDDWNEEAYQNELREREICDYCLYVITPAMKGIYSIAEVVDDSNKRPEKTIYCFLEEENGKKFEEGIKRGLDRVGRMVERNGGNYFRSLQEVAFFLNISYV